MKTWFRNMLDRRTSHDLLRYALYTLGVFLVTFSMRFFGRHGYDALFHEGGVLETLQVMLLTVCALLLLSGAFVMRARRELLLVLAGPVMLVVAREMDYLLKPALPVLGWKIGYLPLLAILWRLRDARRNAAFAADMRRFVQSQPFCILWAAFLTAIPVAQLLGDGTLLQNLLADDFTRAFKRVIEELLESVGYVLLLIGCIETLRWSRDSVVANPAEGSGT